MPSSRVCTKNATPVELLGSADLTPLRSISSAVAFSCFDLVTRRLFPSTRLTPFGWRLNVRFPLSVAFIVPVLVEPGAIIVLLPAY
jgi:hypothetical protein